MSRASPFPRYLLRLATAATMSAAAVAAINVAVDPYFVWGSPRIEAVNAKTPRATRQDGLARSYQVERVRPATLLLGNSRVEVGVAPESKLWPAEFGPVFNLAQPGYDVGGALLLMRHAAAARMPKRIYLGIDFVDFLTAGDPPSGRPSPLARRLRYRHDGSPNPEFWKSRLTDRAASLVSLTALRDTTVTFLSQADANADTMTPLGFNPLRSAIDATRIEGYHAFFLQKNLAYAARYLGRPLRLEDDSAATPFGRLRALLAFARQNGIETTLFIHPYHADFLEILRHGGFVPVMEAFKRQVTAMVAEANAGPGGPAVTLWDFSGYHRPATEIVPPPRDRQTVLQWYWESGHYKQALGDLMIQRMLGRPASDPQLAIGNVLTPASVDEALAGFERDRAAYAAAAPDAVRRVAALVAPILSARQAAAPATGKRVDAR